jgi:hypothetical protein
VPASVMNRFGQLCLVLLQQRMPRLRHGFVQLRNRFRNAIGSILGSGEMQRLTSNQPAVAGPGTVTGIDVDV